MEVTFLGTSGAVPTTKRNPSSLFLQREGDRFLFDVGEGTQRQMMRFSTGFDVSTIFLTHLHGDHVLGLPGLLQTWDSNERTKPLKICTPSGTGTDIEQFLTASGTNPDYPVRICELTSGDTALKRDEYTIEAFETEHRTRSLGYALVEAERKGRFDRERALELGVPEGPMFGRLHEGNPAELADGTVIHPDEVVGEPRPGRRVVYTGDTRPTDQTVSIASDADLLVHDAMFAQDRADRAQETGHSTAEEAATVAQRAGVKRLALTHVSSRYADDTSQLLREAKENFDDRVFLPDDGRTIDLPYTENDRTDN